ncbi:FAD-linked sulfhydryl oxidase ALR [Copidosoma floridanum]|uniref:FAD-linked sulfhydryl oxidase ALR n=1 Tax=Copidosoma floridanum TaxID=29053 RepID=UPI0006C9CB5A|nr:FAD-linked sulfhydryl oxidase ALR [Copidosoma floridanum]
MEIGADGKPCRACSDFKYWAKLQKKAFYNESKNSEDKNPDKKSVESTAIVSRKDCPLDRGELGSSTWSFLHTMAAYYPDTPTAEQKTSMSTFFNLFAKFYPCRICAEDLQAQLEESPPQTDSQHRLSQWLCDIHNEVNEKLGKPLFDCKLVNQRWRDGWADGSCDQ